MPLSNDFRNFSGQYVICAISIVKFSTSSVLISIFAIGSITGLRSVHTKRSILARDLASLFTKLNRFSARPFSGTKHYYYFGGYGERNFVSVHFSPQGEIFRNLMPIFTTRVPNSKNEYCSCNVISF